jgi:hypothetical protein
MRNYNFTLPFLRGACVLLAFCQITVTTGIAQTIETEGLMVTGPKSNRINFVFVSEGIQPAEMGTFITKAQLVSDYLFNDDRCSPFTEYKSFFNTYAIKVPSAESGITHAGTAADESSSNNQPVQTRDTYFDACFDVAGIHRLVAVQSTNQVLSVAGAHVPEYDQVMVLCNSPYYGGSGGQVATFADVLAPQVAQHELGHSYAFLADEYFATAWEKPNMTQDNNPATVKWKNWLGIDDIGIYPYGSFGAQATWYRPSQNCVMQYLGTGFCAVCKQAIVDRMHHDIEMIEGFTPATTAFTLMNTGAPFFTVSSLQTTNNTIKIKWYLNNNPEPFAQDIPFASIPFNKLRPGDNVVRADVMDTTVFATHSLAAVGYISSVQWTVTNPLALATTLQDFSGRVENTSGIISWKVDDYDETARFELEKSSDGVDFKLAATLKADPDNNYTYTDVSLYEASTYYRLKIYTADAPKYVSRVIRLEQPLSSLTYKVYQNAAARKYQVVGRAAGNSSIGITVLDVNGAQLLYRKANASNGSFSYPIDLSTAPAGTYFLRIQVDKKIYTAKLVAL